MKETKDMLVRKVVVGKQMRKGRFRQNVAGFLAFTWADDLKCFSDTQMRSFHARADP
jgi:hypothetical protein